MECNYREICGGCSLRHLTEEEYRHQKQEALNKLLPSLHQDKIKLGKPIFIEDGCRRRASLAFNWKKKQLILGFNQNKSSTLVDIERCVLLTPGLNKIIAPLRHLLAEICSSGYNEKKGKKVLHQPITSGDAFICETSNGIDIVLEYDAPLEMEHRLAVSDLAFSEESVIRVSHRRKNADAAEPIVEKIKPSNTIFGINVYIPAGTFLQPSKEGEQALAGLVLNYLGTSGGKIADLFCGVGTFSYAMAQNPHNKIIAVDSSPELLSGFQESINKNQISNIKIMQRNLFKYPLDANEIKSFNVVVFDPPRAGAAAQVKVISAMKTEDKPEKMIAVSCNPHTFINDANMLLDGGYKLEEITLVDQFVRSPHSEIVALFVKK